MGNCLDLPKGQLESHPDFSEKGGQSGNQQKSNRSMDGRKGGQYDKLDVRRSMDPQRGGGRLNQVGQYSKQREKTVSASAIRTDFTDIRDESWYQIESLRQEIRRQNHELENYRKKSFEDGQAKDRLQEAIGKRDRQISQLRQELQDKENLLARLQEAIGKRDIQISQLRQELQDVKKDTEGLLASLHETTRKRDRQIALLTQELQDVKNDRESLLTRYSALVGSKLTDGNANIADLSDENRPTKLAEKYSELYDNEWTDAFCGLTEGGRTEEMACHILAHAFCTIYSTCRRVADHDMVTFINATKSFYKVEILPKEMIKAAKDKRKRNPGNNFEKLKKCCGDDLKRLLSPEEQTRVSEYLQKSIDICWLMAIQDPPVFADTNMSRRDQKFNTAVYKPYTKSGEYIDFIVWPILFLFEGGNVLCKGIAQGKESRQTNQPYDNVQIIRKTQDQDVKVSLITVSHPVSGSVRGTGYTSTVIRHDPGGRDNAMGPHTVYLAAPRVTGLKEGMNESQDSNRSERSAKSPDSEQKKYVSLINTNV